MIAPKVSIIIPTYNRALELARALQSIYDQSYQDWEIIVIDNSSIDNTKGIVRDFNDGRIKFISVENKGVIAFSRNVGIRASRGKYIAFLDSDDWWAPNKLEKSMSYLDSGFDFVYHDEWIVTPNSEFRRLKKIGVEGIRGNAFIELMTRPFSIPNSSVILRAELLAKIGGLSEDADLITVEDFDAWLRISLITNKLVCIPECLGYYWVGANNESKPHNTLQNKIIRLYERYIPHLGLKQQKQARGIMSYKVARAAYSCSDFTLGSEYFYIAISSPISLIYRIKAFYSLMCCLMRQKRFS